MISYLSFSKWPGHLDLSCKDGTAWTSLSNLRQTINNTGNISCALKSFIWDPPRSQKSQVLLLTVIVTDRPAHSQRLKTAPGNAPIDKVMLSVV